MLLSLEKNFAKIGNPVSEVDLVEGIAGLTWGMAFFSHRSNTNTVRKQAQIDTFLRCPPNFRSLTKLPERN